MESDRRTTHTDRSEASVSDIASPSTRRAMTMSRKAKRIAAIVAALAVAGALSGLGGYLWYLDRFVIAHVEPGVELKRPPGEAEFYGIGGQNVGEVPLKGD